MKQKHLYSLLDTSYTTIAVIFPFAEEAKKIARAQRMGDRDAPWDNAEPQSYVYKAPLDAGVQVGHCVVVDSNAGFRIAKVVRVDPCPQIDVDAAFDYKWIVQRVDTTDYDKRVESERLFSDAMLQIERVRQRELMLKGFQDTLPEGSEARRLFEETVCRLKGPVIDNNTASQ